MQSVVHCSAQLLPAVEAHYPRAAFGHQKSAGAHHRCKSVSVRQRTAKAKATRSAPDVVHVHLIVVARPLAGRGTVADRRLAWRPHGSSYRRFRADSAAVSRKPIRKRVNLGLHAHAAPHPLCVADVVVLRHCRSTVISVTRRAVGIDVPPTSHPSPRGRRHPLAILPAGGVRARFSTLKVRSSNETYEERSWRITFASSESEDDRSPRRPGAGKPLSTFAAPLCIPGSCLLRDMPFPLRMVSCRWVRKGERESRLGG